MLNVVVFLALTSISSAQAADPAPAGWSNLNPREKRLVVLFPLEALVVRRVGKLAAAEAERRYGQGNPSLYDGNGNAFRHTYWNALMARSLGARLAKMFADAHEFRHDGTTMSRDMDLASNSRGRALQAENPGADEALLAERVQAHVDGGKLVRISEGRFVPTDPSR